MGKGAKVAVCVVVWMVTAVATASGSTSAQVIAALNTQRANAGLPAGITENPDWSTACAKHNAYMAAHGRQLIHGEPDTSSPTYSPEGDAIARGAVLSTNSFDLGGNPYENAPIHLHQLLAPRLNVTGVSESDGFNCTSTFGPSGTIGYGRAPVAKPIMYVYPPPGSTGLPTTEVADEGPFTPGEVLGIPRGTLTGRYIHLFVDGPWKTAIPKVKITKATLKTASGEPIEIKVADSEVPTPDGHRLGDYMPQGAQLIPLKALPADAVLDAHVEATVEGAAVAKSWTFGTGSAKVTTTNAARPTLKLGKISYKGGKARFTIKATKQLIGRKATVSFKISGRKGSVKKSVKLRSSRVVSVTGRKVSITITVAAFTVNGENFGPYRLTGRLR
jgi:hypothetical protein